MANAYVSEVTGDLTVATLCAVTHASLDLSATSGGALTIVTPRASVWLANAAARRDSLAGIVAFPPCAGIDVTKYADLTVMSRPANNAKVNALISIGGRRG